MTIDISTEVAKDLCNLKVKLKTGASIVKVKPLFSLDSKSLIVASGTKVKVFNILSGECTQILSYHQGLIACLQHNVENQLQIFSCSNDGIVVRWDFNDGQVLQVYNMRFNVSALYIPSATGHWFVTRKFNGCFKCHKEGHMSRDCPNRGSRGSGGKGCYNCGESGHMSGECPIKNTGGGSGNNGCFNCGKSGHMSRECPTKSSGKNCYSCGESGHFSRECPRKSSSKGGDGNKVCFNYGESGHMSRKCPTKEGGGRGSVAKSCFICKEDGHIARDCPNDVDEDGECLRKSSGKGGGGNKVCFNCGESGHKLNDCPTNIYRDSGKKDCFNSGESGHMSRECPTKEGGGRGSVDKSCFICKEDGHIARDCPNDVDEDDTFELYSLIYKEEKCEVQLLSDYVNHKENSIAFDSEGKYLAYIFQNILTVCDLKTLLNVRHKAGVCTLTCLAFHPSELVLATGDSRGRAIVWSDILSEKKPIKTIYHWHSLPLADLVFTTGGTYLYTVGGEATLLKWNLFSHEPLVLPRLGDPICYVSVTVDNKHVVTAHESNALKIIDYRNVSQVIQGLTQGHFQGSKTQNTLPTGMLYDPRTKALVMNGMPGHLQFYNVHEEKQLFNLDITSRNFITQERDTVIFNIDVQKAAFDDKGCWLATSEYWDDEETSPQIWLKFWMFDSTAQSFVLNTNVILPHNKSINCIIFEHKPSDSCSAPLAVTTSSDCKFKIWSLKEDDGDKQSWTCDAMGCYRDLPAKDACFSEEGSVLAIAFGGAATLWKVDNITLNAVLCNDKTKQDIVQLMFGRQTCSHFLICHDGSAITVWNVLSLTLVWVVHTKVQFLIQDSTSDIVAAFFHNQNLIIFRPTSPQPIYSAKFVCKKPVIAAIFIPNVSSEEDKSGCFHKNSQFFFMDEERHLFTLTDEKDLDLTFEKKLMISHHVPMTPYGKLQAEQKISSVKTTEPEQLILDFQDKDKFVSQISCPTLQDPLALCSTILPSLLRPLQKSKNEPEPTEMKSEKDEDSESEKKLDKYDINSQDNRAFYTDFSFLNRTFILLSKKSVNM